MPDEARTGTCPACRHGSYDAIVFDRCGLCLGIGEIPCGRVWTADEDLSLREHVYAITATAIHLRRPLHEIHARLSELNLKGLDLPSVVRLRTRDGRGVVIDDPARPPERW